MKRFLKRLGLVLLVGLLIAIVYQYPKLNILTGYSAKNMNSAVFLAHRNFAFADSTDNNFFPVSLAQDQMNFETKHTKASVWGLMKREAIYRDGVGSVLLINKEDENRSFLQPVRKHVDVDLPYPYGELPQKDTLFPEIDYSKLENAVADAFQPQNKTRVVLVIYKDQIIAEAYAPGFDKNSKILGWSMTKSLTATIYGILQSQGKLSVHNKVEIEVWQNDNRSNITLDNLLRMSSGLAWDENYFTMSDVTRMLYLEKDMSQVQIRKAQNHTPASYWNYSSGTSNLLSGYLKKYFATKQQYMDFWYTDFIDKIGMYSTVIETDLSNNYVGSSYAWATPRDWAKFGLLYLHRGRWNGEQIFEPEWVDYVTKPTEHSDGQYGAHFWLNAGKTYPNAPSDLYSANGFQGQHVFVVPSKDMVIVRMGLAEYPNFDTNAFLGKITAIIQ
ncbi:MAG: serine hydrolase [Flavobacteriaceae bacterium]|nr:serine hydrolase [Flavobacteriaceae bacterium]